VYVGLFGFVGMLGQYLVVPFLSGRMKLHDTTIGNKKYFIMSKTSYQDCIRIILTYVDFEFGYSTKVKHKNGILSRPEKAGYKTLKQ
jgi:hypothetical protein